MSPVIEVVGLGPAGDDLLTVGTRALIDEVPVRFLRTAVHPAATAVGDATTFDHLYERADTFDAVYEAIVAELLGAARRHGRVLYAVPGSPVVAERTVELLGERATGAGVELRRHPALSFVDLAWARLGVDPVALGATLVDGHRVGDTRPAGGGAVLVAQCESRFTLSDLKLSVDPPPEAPVTLLHHLGLPDEAVVELDWADLDRTLEPDHLTSVWVPELPPLAGGRLESFAALLERLRAEDAWKATQTHDTLRRYLLEEAHEVLEALDAYDPHSGEGAEALAAELGDLLYQVVFHASLGDEAGWFDLGDVVSAIHDKLARRHPHLGAGESPAVEQLVAEWESAKVVEHGRRSAFDGIPSGLPSLLRLQKLERKAGALGLQLPAVEPADPGAELFAAARRATAAGADPEDDLRRLLARLEAQLRAAEATGADVADADGTADG